MVRGDAQYICYELRGRCSGDGLPNNKSPSEHAQNQELSKKLFGRVSVFKTRFSNSRQSMAKVTRDR